MGTQVSYLEDLPEIQSEFIEPYTKRFLMSYLEGVAIGLTKPSEMRDALKGVEHFISMFGGIHSRYATANVYGDLCKLTDEQIFDVATKTFKNNLESKQS
jgi:hypothetical protein